MFSDQHLCLSRLLCLCLALSACHVAISSQGHSHPPFLFGFHSSPFALDLRRFLLVSGFDSQPVFLALPRLAFDSCLLTAAPEVCARQLADTCSVSRAPPRFPIYWMCFVPFCQKEQPLMPHMRVMFSRHVLHMSVASRSRYRLTHPHMGYVWLICIGRNECSCFIA